MKKYVVISCILFVVLAIGIIYIFPAMKKSNFREKQQEELAKSLGVKIEDYPYQTSFPSGYFYSILKPGMTYEQVHSIVHGYESVYSCYGTDEIYYYFAKHEKDDALRFALHYKENGHFVEMESEDPNSRTLGLGPGCSDGLLGMQ